MKFNRIVLEIIEDRERSPDQAKKLLDRVEPKIRFPSGDGKKYPKTTMSNTLPKEKIYCKDENGDHIQKSTVHKKGRIRHVDIKTIKSVQNILSYKGLSDYIDNPSNKLPLLVHHDGSHYVVDGNHRINAAKFLRKKRIKAKVVDAHTIEKY